MSTDTADQSVWARRIARKMRQCKLIIRTAHKFALEQAQLLRIFYRTRIKRKRTPIDVHLTFDNMSGSVEHYYHFLFGFFVPLFYADKVIRSAYNPNKLYVRSCGILDKIIIEINFPNVVIVDKKAHSHPSNITNDLRKFSFRGYDDPRKYDGKLFLEASDFVKRNLANQILREARTIIGNENDKSGATIVLIDRGPAHEFYGSENSEIKTVGRQRRSIRNFEVLARAVKERYDNVISTRLEEKPLAYQIALFQAADVIIGQHGAAFANLIWARKEIDVVEIVPQDLEADVKDYFASLARCLGQRYHPIQQFHSHGEVNIDEILRILDEILS